MGKVERQFESNLRVEFEGFRSKHNVANRKAGFVINQNIKRLVWQPNGSTDMESKIERERALRQRETCFHDVMFLSDEGPTLRKTSNFTFHIGSAPTFLYFDLYLNTAYAAHHVYFAFRICNSLPMDHRVIIIKLILSGLSSH